MNKLITISSVLLTAAAVKAQTPNIVFILADDLGYGDISAFNPESKIHTPNIDKLAEHGISCNGHAARQLTNRDYDEYDLLIGMDQANLRDMYRICGGDYAEKMSLLMDHTARPGNVADPWYTEDFEVTWQDVLEGCQGLLKEF